MKRIDSLKISLAKMYDGLKAQFTDEELEVELAENTLSDGTKIEYSALEVDAEVFVIVEGEDPALAPDGEHTLSDGQMITTVDGKITEIKPKEEEEPAPVAAELSEEQKEILAIALAFDLDSLKGLVDMKQNGYHTLEFGVQDGVIKWGDIYSNTYKTLLSEQVDPIKVELEAEKTKVTDLEAKIVVLQELNDQKNPLEKVVKLESDKPLTPYEIQLNIKK